MSSNSLIPNLNLFKSRDLIDLTCQECHTNFTRAKHRVQQGLSRHEAIFCSTKCGAIYIQRQRGHGKKQVQCLSCSKFFLKYQAQISKSPNHFCSKSCGAIYRNQHKTTGYRRSKLEKYLEERIRQEFPDLEFETNCRSVIDYELDFYFPTLKLAVEVNGPTHYRPVYSQEKFSRIQEIDREKVRMCQQLGISLLVIPNLSNFDVRLAERTFIFVQSNLATHAGNDLRADNPTR